MGGRSRCMHCGHTLGSLDLVPIFSYVFLGGRCRYCGARISAQYPLVEAAAAALSLMVYLAHPASGPREPQHHSVSVLVCGMDGTSVYRSL